MTPISIASLVVGIAALLLAISSKRKQKKAEERQKELIEKQDRIENRIEQKEELREMAEAITSVVTWTKEFRDHLSPYSEYDGVPHPDHHSTLWGQLYHLSKDAIGYSHLTSGPATISISVFNFVGDEEKVPIEDASEAIDLYDNNRSPTISLTLDDDVGYSQDVLFCHLDQAFFGAGKFKARQQNIREPHGELINEFSPGILDELEDQLDTIIQGCTQEALNSQPDIEIEPSKFDRVDDIAEFLFTTVMWYDGIEQDIEKLAKLIDELEKTRDNVLQTSYS